MVLHHFLADGPDVIGVHRSEFIGLVRRGSTLLALFLLPVNFPHRRLPPGHIRSPSPRRWTRRLTSITTPYDRRRQQDLRQDCLGSPLTWT
jgi:hypothetical protein